MTNGRRAAESGGVLRGILIFLLVATLLVGGCVYACVKKTADLAGSAVDAIGRKFDGDWDERERADDPAGYLAFLIKRLERAAGELEESGGELRRAAESARKRREANATALRDVVDELESLRASYRTGGPTYLVGDEEMDEASLKRRVASALGRRAVYEASEARFQSTIVSIDDAVAAIPERLAEAKARVETLETERDLMKAKRSSEGLTRTIELAAASVERIEKATSSTPLRTLQEIEADAAKASSPGVEAASAFLKGG